MLIPIYELIISQYKSITSKVSNYFMLLFFKSTAITIYNIKVTLFFTSTLKIKFDTGKKVIKAREVVSCLDLVFTIFDF